MALLLKNRCNFERRPPGASKTRRGESADSRGRKRKNLIDFINQGLCGVTRNRTGDTRIFSPLLYQLSYDTIALLSICGCKGRAFLPFLQVKEKKTFGREKKNVIFFSFSQKHCTFAPATPQRAFEGIPGNASESSAVGSALRSGRRGRAFESPLSDKIRDSRLPLNQLSRIFVCRRESGGPESAAGIARLAGECCRRAAAPVPSIRPKNGLPSDGSVGGPLSFCLQSSACSGCFSVWRSFYPMSSRSA